MGIAVAPTGLIKLGDMQWSNSVNQRRSEPPAVAGGTMNCGMRNAELASRSSSVRNPQSARPLPQAVLTGIGISSYPEQRRAPCCSYCLLRAMALEHSNVARKIVVQHH